MLAAQLAGLVVLLTLPPRPPAPVPMDQAIERIREAVKLVEGRQGQDAAREARSASDRRRTTPALRVYACALLARISA